MIRHKFVVYSILLGCCLSVQAQDFKTADIQFTCPSGTKFESEFRYKRPACLAAAKKYAPIFVCNETNQQEAISACEDACGNNICLDTALYDAPEPVFVEPKPAPAVVVQPSQPPVTAGNDNPPPGIAAKPDKPKQLEGVWQQVNTGVSRKGFVSELSIKGKRVKSCDWERQSGRVTYGKVTSADKDKVVYVLDGFEKYPYTAVRSGKGIHLSVAGFPPSLLLPGKWQSSIDAASANVSGEKNLSGFTAECGGPL